MGMLGVKVPAPCVPMGPACYRRPEMPTRIPKGKVLLSVAIDPELREAARAAAEKEEITLTVFVTRALRERLAETPTGGPRRGGRPPTEGQARRLKHRSTNSR